MNIYNLNQYSFTVPSTNIPIALSPLVFRHILKMAISWADGVVVLHKIQRHNMQDVSKHYMSPEVERKDNGGVVDSSKSSWPTAQSLAS